MADITPVIYGISVHEIIRKTGISQATAFRWKAGGSIPGPMVLLLRLLIHGDLSVLDKAFEGWTLKSGKLISPANDEFTPGEIQAIPYKQRLIVHYQNQQRFPLQADWVAGQYVVKEISSNSAVESR